MAQAKGSTMVGRLLAIGVWAAVLATGCSGSSSDAESSASAPVITTTPSVIAADGGCSVATVDGSTENQDMLDLATEVYESLQCGGEQTLDEQLRAAAGSPQVTERVSAAGLTVSVDSAASGTVMQLVQLEDRSACNITVIDSLDAKTLNCADL
jgi:hypothetical protein